MLNDNRSHGAQGRLAQFGPFSSPTADSINLDAFPSSVAFENIHGALQSDAQEKKNAIKTGQAIFAFELKNGEGKTESWHIDLKESGNVGRGKAPEGKGPDGKASYAVILGGAGSSTDTTWAFPAFRPSFRSSLYRHQYRSTLKLEASY